MAADLADVKAAYREQIEFLASALEAANTPPVTPVAAPATDAPQSQPQAPASQAQHN